MTEMRRQLGSGPSTSSGPLSALARPTQRQQRALRLRSGGLPRLRAALPARARLIRAAALRSGCLRRKSPSTSPRSGPLGALVGIGTPYPAPTARPHRSPGHRPEERAPKSIPRHVGINLAGRRPKPLSAEAKWRLPARMICRGSMAPACKVDLPTSRHTGGVVLGKWRKTSSLSIGANRRNLRIDPNPNHPETTP